MPAKMYSRTSATISSRGNLKFHDAFAEEGGSTGIYPEGEAARQECSARERWSAITGAPALGITGSAISTTVPRRPYLPGKKNAFAD